MSQKPQRAGSGPWVMQKFPLQKNWTRLPCPQKRRTLELCNISQHSATGAGWQAPLPRPHRQRLQPPAAARQAAPPLRSRKVQRTPMLWRTSSNTKETKGAPSGWKADPGEWFTPQCQAQDQGQSRQPAAGSQPIQWPQAPPRTPQATRPACEGPVCQE